jgi:hypothetical protein
MWMDEQTAELKQRISHLSDQELLNIIQVNFKDYRPEAINFARQELTRRGVEFKEQQSDRVAPGETSPEEENSSGDPTEARACIRCGGETRPGMMVGTKEIIVYFTDRNEQRFLKLYACGQCGHTEMVTDFETEITGYENGALGESYPEQTGAAQRCPQCGWETDPSEEWLCGKCGCLWNTFETGGRCPLCQYQWKETTCNSCGESSPHEDWYVKQKPRE